MKALLYPGVGSENPIEVEPKNGKTFELRELQDLVNGMIEVASLSHGEIMIMNEEGTLFNLPVNYQATVLFNAKVGPGTILGPALVCKSEMVP